MPAANSLQAGIDADPDAVAAAIDGAIDSYHLVAVDDHAADTDETLLVVGPVAFPALPDGAADLPHIMDVPARDVARDAVIGRQGPLPRGCGDGRQERRRGPPDTADVSCDIEAGRMSKWTASATVWTTYEPDAPKSRKWKRRVTRGATRIKTVHHLSQATQFDLSRPTSQSSWTTTTGVGRHRSGRHATAGEAILARNALTTVGPPGQMSFPGGGRLTSG